MEICRINDFLSLFEPWLDRDYVRKAILDNHDRLVLYFADGGHKTYQIDDCTRVQMQDIVDKLLRGGIPVEKI